MKLAPFLLAAPVVFTMVAADPRPTPQVRRVLDRWQFPRQDDTSSTAAAGGGASAVVSTSTPAVTPTTPTTTKETPTSTTPTSTPVETTPTSPAQQPTSTTSPTSPAQQSTTTSTSAAARPTSSSTSSTPQQQPSPNTPVQSPTSNQAAPTSTTPTSTSFILSTPPPTTAAISTTDEQGRVITTIVVMTQSAKSVAVAPTSTEAAAPKGVSQSTIIGLAVTGSIAGLLVILLIVWKLTGKRFSDLEDNDDDAIKWPELHKDSAAMTPIPARPSTRAAGSDADTLAKDFDTQSAAHSAADLTYAPYSDDPGYGARPAYYDPYGGAPGAAKTYPSPPGSHDGEHKTWGPSADGQYYDPPRGQSPGPNIARGMSPGPNMAYDNRVASPAPPSMAYADPVGRTGSPGPAAYGYGAGYAQPDPYGGRNSPGPNMAYAQPEIDPYGRQSPGPGMAYNASVGRVASPGPGAVYR